MPLSLRKVMYHCLYRVKFVLCAHPKIMIESNYYYFDNFSNESDQFTYKEACAEEKEKESTSENHALPSPLIRKKLLLD